MVNPDRLRQYASSDKANVVLGTAFQKSPEGPQARTQLQTPRAHFLNTRDVELNCSTELGQVVPGVDLTRRHGTKGLQN
jgi:hypothetical protein